MLLPFHQQRTTIGHSRVPYDSIGTSLCNFRPAIDCCPSGSLCPSPGITIRTLPIKRGYYRLSNASHDVRRCPDAYANCGDELECQESNSGCRGGDDVDASCADGLTGPFCLLCRDDALFHRAATGSATAKCVDCGEDGLVGRTFGYIAAFIVALILRPRSSLISVS